MNHPRQTAKPPSRKTTNLLPFPSRRPSRSRVARPRPGSRLPARDQRRKMRRILRHLPTQAPLSPRFGQLFESCPLRLGDWQHLAGHRTDSHKPLSVQGLVSFYAGRCDWGRAPAVCGLCAAFRGPSPLLSQSVALAWTSSPKSAIHKGLGAFFGGGLKAPSSHRTRTVSHPANKCAVFDGCVIGACCPLGFGLMCKHLSHSIHCIRLLAVDRLLNFHVLRD